MAAVEIPGTGLALSIELEGDWKRAIDIAGSLEKHATVALQDLGKHTSQVLHERLMKQAQKQLKKPAAGTLLKRKLEGIGSRQAMIATGELLNAIQIHKVGDGYFIGVYNAEHKASKATLAKIFQLNEKDRVFFVKKTPEVQAKLIQNFEGKKGRPKSKPTRTPGGSWTGFVIVRVPGRPIFSVIEKEMLRDTTVIVSRALQFMETNLRRRGIPVSLY